MDNNYFKEVVSLAKKIKQLESRRTDAGFIREVLEYLVEGFASDHAGPSDIDSIARNHGVKIICEQLDRLKEELDFAEDYKVRYEKITPLKYKKSRK